jgi:hypothetical protein
MGMFDTILVKQSLINSLVDEEIKSALQKSVEDDYYHFQTKDLENFLWLYYIEEDLKMYEKKNRIEADENARFGVKTISLPKTFSENVTEYIEFYDFLGDVGENSVFITFKAHVLKGEVKSIELLNIEKTPLAQIRDDGKKSIARWEKIRADWNWKVMEFVQKFTWKLEKLILRPLNIYQEKLRKSVIDKYPEE